MNKNFLDNKAAQKVLETLAEQVYFVGGAVRDKILHISGNDIDMATPLLPEEATKKLKAAGCCVVPTGLAFGTVTVIYKKHHVELTTFRKDIHTDGRHAEVIFGTSIKEDAARRDFTINALYMNQTGDILDFFHGLRDLKKGHVRFIGEPTKRIEEDYLRILRFFRFWGRFGKGKPDQKALHACHTARKKINILSLQRLHDEMMKIFALPRADIVLRYMARTGVLKEMISGPWNFKALRRVIARERRLNLLNKPDIIARLCAFIPQSPAPTWLQNKERRALTALRKALQEPNRQKALFLYGAQAVQRKELICRRHMTQKSFQDIQKWKEPKFPFRVEDMLRQGKTTEKELNQAFKYYKEIWLNLGCPSEKEVVFQALSR